MAEALAVCCRMSMRPLFSQPAELLVSEFRHQVGMREEKETRKEPMPPQLAIRSCICIGPPLSGSNLAL